MQVNRSLFHTNVYYLNSPQEGHICEAGDPAAAVLMAPEGTVMDDAEAQRLGITEYLAQHPAPPAAEAPAPEAKAVEQTEVEDKAVTPAEEKTAETPAPEEVVPIDAEVRRGPGRSPRSP